MLVLFVSEFKKMHFTANNISSTAIPKVIFDAILSVVIYSMLSITKSKSNHPDIVNINAKLINKIIVENNSRQEN